MLVPAPKFTPVGVLALLGTEGMRALCQLAAIVDREGTVMQGLEIHPLHGEAQSQLPNPQQLA